MKIIMVRNKNRALFDALETSVFFSFFLFEKDSCLSSNTTLIHSRILKS